MPDLNTDSASLLNKFSTVEPFSSGGNEVRQFLLQTRVLIAQFRSRTKVVTLFMLDCLFIMKWT